MSEDIEAHNCHPDECCQKEVVIDAPLKSVWSDKFLLHGGPQFGKKNGIFHPLDLIPNNEILPKIPHSNFGNV